MADEKNQDEAIAYAAKVPSAAVGSIDAAAHPARVFKGIRGPGQMGNKRVTQKGLEVVRVDADNNLLLVRGSVPGPRNGVVEVRTDA